MPFNSRIFRSRRFYGRRYTRKAHVAKKVKTYVRKAIKRKSSSKYLWYQNAGIAATGNGIDTTGRIAEITDMTIGSDIAQREGRTIQPQSFRIKGYMEAESTTVNNTVRIICFTLFDGPLAGARTASACLGKLFGNAGYNIGSIPQPGTGRVFKDLTFSMNHWGSGTYEYYPVDFRVSFPKNFVSTYDYNAETAATKHPIYVAIFSDSSAINDPGWVQGATYQFRYKDN